MRLDWADRASADLLRAYDFHDQYSNAKAERVVRRLRERASTLLVTPYVGRPVGKAGVRELSIPDIQYVIVYRVETDAVEIARIFSTAENR